MERQALTEIVAKIGRAPPPPSDRFAALVGQYGETATTLDLFEDDGALRAWGAEFGELELVQTVAGFTTRTGATGVRARITADGAMVELAGRRVPARDFGAELIAQFQHMLQIDAASIATLAEAAARTSAESASPSLIPVRAVAPGIRVDLRYATANNFAGIAVYDVAEAFCRPEVAAALARVYTRVAELGYGLLIFDAYRPWYVTKLFWDIVPLSTRAFVADPATGSNHNRGCAIDLTLCTPDGVEVKMPSRYDEPTRRAHASYSGGTSRQRWHRDLLREAMVSECFVINQTEWWHFDYDGAAGEPIVNVPIGSLLSQAGSPAALAIRA